MHRSCHPLNLALGPASHASSRPRRCLVCFQRQRSTPSLALRICTGQVPIRAADAGAQAASHRAGHQLRAAGGGNPTAAPSCWDSGCCPTVAVKNAVACGTCCVPSTRRGASASGFLEAPRLGHAGSCWAMLCIRLLALACPAGPRGSLLVATVRHAGRGCRGEPSCAAAALAACSHRRDSRPGQLGCDCGAGGHLRRAAAPAARRPGGAGRRRCSCAGGSGGGRSCRRYPGGLRAHRYGCTH